MTLSPRMLAETDKATGHAVSADDTLADGVNPKVEYDVLDLANASADELKRRLNAMGEQGWQLVSAAPVFIFQRLMKPKELRGPVGFKTAEDMASA